MNCNGVILYTEFIAATLELHGRVEEKRLAEAFDLMDDDDSGFISKEVSFDLPPSIILRKSNYKCVISSLSCRRI